VTVALKAYGNVIVAVLTTGWLMVSYHTALMRERYGSLRLETLGCRFDATTTDLLKFYRGNLALVALTLSFGYLLLPFRVWQFYTRHPATIGGLDTDGLGQTTLIAPGQGDGIADAFDVGAF